MSEILQSLRSGKYITSPLRPFLFGLAYFCFAGLSDHLEQWRNILSHFWLPSGLYLAGLLLNKPSQWPLLIITAGVGDALYNHLSSSPWPLSLWLLAHVGNSAAAVTGAWLVRRFVSTRPNLSSPKELMGLLALGGVVGCALAGAVGAFAVRLRLGTSDYLSDFSSWYASDLLGVILFTPTVIAWWRVLFRPSPKTALPSVELVLIQLALLATISSTLYFHLLRESDSLFISLPFVIWAGARFGIPGATLSILISSIAVNWFAAKGYGPLALASLSHPQKIVENLVSQGVFAFAGLLPSAVFSKLRETQAREAVRVRTMILLSGGSKLTEILTSIIHGVEAEAPEMVCSIEVMDSSGKQLRLGAAPSIPTYFTNGIHGLEIGPDSGCCGTAAFLDQVVISEDIATDSRWKGAQGLAERAGLKSAWAQPFHDSSNRVVGTFAGFYKERTLPTPHERDLIASLSSVAAMAVERKGLEEQFLRAQRMESIGTLAGGVAHDLNNLLTPISLCTEMLKEEPLTPDGAELLQSIETSAKRGADLVKQVLTFARGVQGARIALNLRLVVNEVGSIVTRTFPKNIQFVVSLPRDLPLIVGDSTQVEQVLLNLCLNARDAMPGGGTIKVTARPLLLDAESVANRGGIAPGLFVEMSVVDEGAGMRPEVVDRIFEPFYTTKELGHGTGLGLSTALGIVRSHGGFIDVASKVGHGSTFRVSFPAVQPGVVQGEGSAFPASIRTGRGETVLLVDDEAEILKSLKRILTANGYKVLTAGNGAEALGVYSASKGDIRLVITDVMMPIMDGASLIRALRNLDGNLPVITVSGLRTQSPEIPDGSWQHLLKPFSAEQLLFAVAKTLDSAPKGTAAS